MGTGWSAGVVTAAWVMAEVTAPDCLATLPGRVPLDSECGGTEPSGGSWGCYAGRESRLHGAAAAAASDGGFDEPCLGKAEIGRAHV